MTGRRVLTITVAALICLVLLGGAALAGPLPASGGGYRLVASPWQVQGTAGGRGFLLQGQSDLLQTGPCCCAYMPCAMRSAP